jgi:hypothetical protein
MILLKNTANQYVYTRLFDQTSKLPITGVLGTAVTAYVSKDGGTEATSTNTLAEVGHGIYKLLLDATETNCSSGSVMVIHNTITNYQFQHITFQTSESSPSVTVSTNNDKTGYSLSDPQSFSTTGSVGSVTNATTIITAIKAATYNGISQDKIQEMLIAFMANKAVITTVDANTRTISYKKRDGSTESFNITVSTADGARASGGTIGP